METAVAYNRFDSWRSRSRTSVKDISSQSSISSFKSEGHGCDNGSLEKRGCDEESVWIYWWVLCYGNNGVLNLKLNETLCHCSDSPSSTRISTNWTPRGILIRMIEYGLDCGQFVMLLRHTLLIDKFPHGLAEYIYRMKLWWLTTGTCRCQSSMLHGAELGLQEEETDMFGLLVFDHWESARVGANFYMWGLVLDFIPFWIFFFPSSALMWMARAASARAPWPPAPLDHPRPSTARAPGRDDDDDQPLRRVLQRPFFFTRLPMSFSTLEHIVLFY